ncbi:iron-sulfur cluster assembly accessory protein [Allomyces macrogynus ATCC 38327]|nr:iron-sulfur cluster assembly accessory protein [Allomyces macrogynus ATCC 38327]|eukprot:KNE58459.1 iron-sulfur cluster assembly accessory protein [Allomyces macrogynus ATCC 38327]
MPLQATVRAVAGSMPRARKAVLSMTPAAVSRIKEMSKPEALLRVGVKKKGCSGLSYTIDQVSAKQRFDEEVVQDGASILIDSKALLSILGSEMDYVEDKLSAQFVFYNPNVKEACGCGQSFMI